MLDVLATGEAQRWQQNRGSAVQVAIYRALAHDRAGMLRWLAVATDGHDHNLSFLQGFPEFSSYSQDPEFVAIVNRPH